MTPRNRCRPIVLKNIALWALFLGVLIITLLLACISTEQVKVEFPFIREIIMQNQTPEFQSANLVNICSDAGQKLEMVNNLEPLILKESLKPWVTFQQNLVNVKYLPLMINISLEGRFLYVDVGARGHNSSIESWFLKQYPAQNKTFHVYAIEADKRCHEEYRGRKGITLLPYAAWVRDETISFQLDRVDGPEFEDKTNGMGRMVRRRPEKESGQESKVASAVLWSEVKAFDFASWLNKMVKANDFVVVKIDVEGTEFDLIPRLLETGAICLIDEMFLECHYDWWDSEACCPRRRISQFGRTYEHWLELFTSLRNKGVPVHRWF